MKTDRFLRRDIAQSVGSSGLAFALTLFTTPLMTRLFPAEAYGINGMLQTAASLVSAFGLLGLPVALAGAQAEPVQSRLLHASVQFSLLLALLTGIGVLGALFIVGDRSTGLTPFVAWLFPLLVLAYAGQRIADSLSTARGLFPPQAASRLANSATARGSTLLLGWLHHSDAAMMVLGDALGKCVHIAVTVRAGRLGPVWHDLRWWPRPAFLRSMLREYRVFALHSNLASLLPVVTLLGLQSLIGLRLGAAATGQYVLAQSMLSLPVSLVAMATAPVVFHHLIRVEDETPRRLARVAVTAMLAYLSVGLLSMLPLAFFAPDIFAFVFGDSWRPAGEVAALLCIPQVLAFSLTGLLSLFRVTHRVRAWLGFEVAGVVLVLGGVALLPAPADLAGAALEIAMLSFGYQLLMHLGLFWATSHRRAGHP